LKKKIGGRGAVAQLQKALRLALLPLKLLPKSLVFLQKG
jgi:hypothetical protein